jgi:uncharacterized protein
VHGFARARGWRLDTVDAGEFGDPRYRANPIDRCFFCKSNLYATLGGMTAGVVCSGANTDDLGDYRPGLAAAADYGVRHPYVEAKIAKREVRALARCLGMPDFAELPSSPCLSSRVETGLPIEPKTLAVVDRVEQWLRDATGAGTVRCRVRPAGVEIELDAVTLAGLDAEAQKALIAGARAAAAGLGETSMRLAPYRRGSAFVGDKGAVA